MSVSFAEARESSRIEAEAEAREEQERQLGDRESSEELPATTQGTDSGADEQDEMSPSDTNQLPYFIPGSLSDGEQGESDQESDSDFSWETDEEEQQNGHGAENGRACFVAATLAHRSRDGDLFIIYM